jgi:hypothetical protein
MSAIWGRVGSTAAIVLLAVGCSSIGPETIPRDRFDYVEAIRDSGKEQMLLNMVGLRYAEAPLFLRVTSVISQYSIDARVSAAAPPYQTQAAAAPPLGVSGGYADRPTITYTPMSGAEFTRSVMTPIPPGTIMSLIQAGWRADLILRLAVRSINGVASANVVGSDIDQEKYYEMVSLMQKIQAAGGLSFRVEKRAPDDVAIIIIRGADSQAMKLNRERLRELLGLDPGLSEYRLVFGNNASGRNEIAMLTRSILEMLLDLALWIDVPPEHITAGRTRQSHDADAIEDFGFKPMIHVHSSMEKPDDAFVMVRYDGMWFWIGNEDFRSKRTLGFMQLMFSLAESGGGQQAPVVTVQAGG